MNLDLTLRSKRKLSRYGKDTNGVPTRSLKCQKTFKAYFYNDDLSHTIPKFIGVKAIIVKYLKKNSVASEEELSKNLGIDLKIISMALKELKESGVVYLTEA